MTVIRDALLAVGWPLLVTAVVLALLAFPDVLALLGLLGVGGILFASLCLSLDDLWQDMR